MPLILHSIYGRYYTHAFHSESVVGLGISMIISYMDLLGRESNFIEYIPIFSLDNVVCKIFDLHIFW